MKTKNLIFATLLITLGLILNLITPAFVGLMKPDFLLAMYLIALTRMDSVKEAFVITLVCAILSSMTSMMPGAEIANFIEKCMTGVSVSLIYNLIKNKPSKSISLIIGGMGTLLSGFFFLIIMSLLGFLEANFLMLFMSVVIPTSIVNVFVFGIFNKALRQA